MSIDIFNLNSFLFRRWETIIVFLPSRGLLWGFNIYAVYVFSLVEYPPYSLPGMEVLTLSPPIFKEVRGWGMLYTHDPSLTAA